MEVLDEKNPISTKPPILAFSSLVCSILFLVIFIPSCKEMLGLPDYETYQIGIEITLLFKVLITGSVILSFIFGIANLIMKESWGVIKWAAVTILCLMVACVIGLTIFINTIELY